MTIGILLPPQTKPSAGGHTPLHYQAAHGCVEGLEMLCGVLAEAGAEHPRDQVRAVA